MKEKIKISAAALMCVMFALLAMFTLFSNAMSVAKAEEPYELLSVGAGVSSNRTVKTSELAGDNRGDISVLYDGITNKETEETRVSMSANKADKTSAYIAIDLGRKCLISNITVYVQGNGGPKLYYIDRFNDIAKYETITPLLNDDAKIKSFEDVTEGYNKPTPDYPAATHWNESLFTDATAYRYVVIYLDRKDYGSFLLREVSILGTVEGATALEKTIINQAAVIGDNSIQLSWGAVSGADGYKVYANETLITQTSITATTFTHTNLRPNTAYSYYVIAESNDVSKVASKSDSVSFTTTDSRTNLALDARIIASHTNGDNIASKMNDNDFNTNWYTNTKNKTDDVTLYVDFGGIVEISTLDIVWAASANRAWNYQIYKKLSENYDKAVDYNGSQPDTSYQGGVLHSHNVDAFKARYLKMTMPGSQLQYFDGPAIKEFIIKGSRESQPVFLTAPTIDIESVVVSDTSISFSWNKIDAATGYKVLANGVVIKTIESNQTTSVTIQKRPGVSATYTVTSFSSDSESLPSEGVVISTTDSRTNIAKNGIAVYSSKYSDEPKAESRKVKNAFDGDKGGTNHWEPRYVQGGGDTNPDTNNKSPIGEWIQVDLGKKYDISAVEIYFALYQIGRIQGSVNKTDFTDIKVLALEDGNPANPAEIFVDLAPQSRYRYIRYMCEGEVGPWGCGVLEMMVFGEKAEFEVTFSVVGVETVVSAEKGASIDNNKIPAATKVGYTFNQWSCDVEFNLENIQSDLYLVADFTINKYAVNFYLGTELYGAAQSIEYNKVVTLPTNPTQPNKVFKGWAVKDTTEIIDLQTTKIVEDMNFVAIFADAYSVIFKNGADNFSESTIEAGLKVVKPTSDPSQNKKHFIGWAIEGETTIVDVETITVNSDKTFVAIYIDKYNILFKNGDVVVSEQEIKADEKPSYPTDITKEGYDFKGWALVGQSEIIDISNYEITADTTFVAVFEETKIEDNKDKDKEKGGCSSIALMNSQIGFAILILAISLLIILKKKTNQE